MRLILLHPFVAERSCRDCCKYMYDDTVQRMGLPLIRGGEKVERLPRQVPRCEWCPKIPRGAQPIPANAVELNERNHQAWIHYRECAAIGRFPEDAIVRRNAAIIKAVADYASEYHRSNDTSDLLQAALSRFSQR